jgi:hypothetical protein
MKRSPKHKTDEIKNSVVKNLPSTFELASLAVQLMRVDRFKDNLELEMEDFIELAWDLHYGAMCRISEVVAKADGFQEFKTRNSKSLRTLPKPDKYPILLPQALGLLMPNRDRTARSEIYWEYLEKFYRHTIEPARWEEWRRLKIEHESINGFDEVGWKALGITFSKFMDERKALLRQEKARQAGKIRMKKTDKTA